MSERQRERTKRIPGGREREKERKREREREAGLIRSGEAHGHPKWDPSSPNMGLELTKRKIMT